MCQFQSWNQGGAAGAGISQRLQADLSSFAREPFYSSVSNMVGGFFFFFFSLKKTGIHFFVAIKLEMMWMRNPSNANPHSGSVKALQLPFGFEY